MPTQVQKLKNVKCTKFLFFYAFFCDVKEKDQIRRNMINFYFIFLICLKLGLVRPVQQKIKLPLSNDHFLLFILEQYSLKNIFPFLTRGFLDIRGFSITKLFFYCNSKQTVVF